MSKPAKRIRVLMVCLGNICRSPTAEAVLRHQVTAAGLADYIEVDSAGTGDWHCGDPPDPRTLRAAAKRSYDLTPLRARQVSQRDFEDFDYVFAMDRQNLSALRALAPQGTEHKVSLFLEHGGTGHDEVPDPYYRGHDDFELVLDLVEQASAALLDELRARHGLPR
ncbi:MAG: low molecular weight protein-tyrosine-phosphatase [Pseudomonadota bacterium]|nr:low molecular weight protein-tyrosine-phosphatase [Pseudomonadota bacterium]